MAKTKENQVLDNLEQEKQWIEAFHEYNKKAAQSELDEIMNKRTGVMMDIFRLEALNKLVLETHNPEDMQFAITKHQNLRSKISKKYKILLK